MPWDTDYHPDWLKYATFEVNVTSEGKGSFRRRGAGMGPKRFFDVTFEVKPEDRVGNRSHYDEPQHICIQDSSAEAAAEFWVAHLQDAWACTVTILKVEEDLS